MWNARSYHDDMCNSIIYAQKTQAELGLLGKFKRHILLIGSHVV